MRSATPRHSPSGRKAAPAARRNAARIAPQFAIENSLGQTVELYANGADASFHHSNSKEPSILRSRFFDQCCCSQLR